MTDGKQNSLPSFLKSWKNSFKRDWQLYLLLLLPVAMVIIFKYASYPGLRIAFLDYKPALGYDGSKFIGFGTFQRIFKDADFLKALKNTLIFNFADLIVGFPMPIILAILLNEIHFKRFKKLSQTILYLPHFLSWVIVASIFTQLLKPETGLVNVLITNLGGQSVPFLTEKYHWAVSYILIAVWQGMGWGTIIYLAAITGINGELYEAATIDGAGRFGKIWHVTLPGIKGTIVTLLIMNLGRMMGSSFERLYSFDNVMVTDFQYQLSIYIYEKGLQAGNFSMATAVGLFQSLVGLILVIASDRFAKLLGEDGLM
ncbi:MAG: putative aldouronate transport system permease protein [Clostridiales bacterium]|nr:sugar transporter ATPase [Oscillospiraceae bacterium]MDN5378139.1 putative aldouronate transport system permease protein [Clostridiales bacterium]